MSTPTSTKSKKEVVKPPSQKLYSTISMQRAKKLATELSKFARENNLQINIAGKQYMQVEGWQFIGTQMGLTDIVKFCDRETENVLDGEIKYKAVVEIINQNGTVISKGFAFASNKESKKKSFEEYAIASMAQTRAIGKAYRNFLAWIVKMAGYEPTPVEELDREQMETDLARLKQKIVKAMREQGITDSTSMMGIIQQAIGKDVVETIDEGYKVLEYLKDDGSEGGDTQT